MKKSIAFKWLYIGADRARRRSFEIPCNNHMVGDLLLRRSNLNTAVVRGGGRSSVTPQKQPTGLTCNDPYRISRARLRL